MSHTYQSRRRAETAPSQGKGPTRAAAPMIGNQSMEALLTGAQAPSTENMGHRVDLPRAIREKMESSFGADFSSVRLYESQAVADAGAQAITMGDKIGFAPGQLDFASSGGQALLGHELSHVVSQARGEAVGNGFLNDHALEARADREGAMAAAGESVYSGPVTPLSASNVSSAVGPMQAKKPKKEEKPLQISEPALVEENTGMSMQYARSLNRSLENKTPKKKPAKPSGPVISEPELVQYNPGMTCGEAPKKHHHHHHRAKSAPAALVTETTPAQNLRSSATEEALKDAEQHLSSESAPAALVTETAPAQNPRSSVTEAALKEAKQRLKPVPAPAPKGERELPWWFPRISSESEDDDDVLDDELDDVLEDWGDGERELPPWWSERNLWRR